VRVGGVASLEAGDARVCGRLFGLTPHPARGSQPPSRLRWGSASLSRLALPANPRSPTGGGFAFRAMLGRDDTDRRAQLESVLQRHAPFTEFWHVRAERERRCCWDPNCTKPRHALGGKILVRVFPAAISRENADRENADSLPEVERVLSSHLDGVAKTRIVPLDPTGKGLRPAVFVRLD
jgi:hypothetical protein